MNLEQALLEAPADIAQAKAYVRALEVSTYRKIGGNEARQFFTLTGQLKNVQNNLSNATEVQVIPGFTTTIGQLCEGVLDTLSNGQFATDPNFEDGQLNLAASQALVDNGVMSQEARDAFFARSVSTSRPFLKTTGYEIMLTRKVDIPKVKVLSVAGVISVRNNMNTEVYNPAIYQISPNGSLLQRGRFSGIGKSGEYQIVNPTRSTELFVDNPYSSLEAM
jgi:hypothetical protein